MSGFVNLHVHTDKSILDGVSSCEVLAQRAASLGQNALAVTDHGNLFAFPDLAKACEKYGLKPIYGCELYMAPDLPGVSLRTKTKHPYSEIENHPDDLSRGGAYSHLTVLARNQAGLRALFRIQKVAWEEGLYCGAPRADLTLLEKENQEQGLVCLTGCPASELNTRLALGQDPQAETYLQKLVKIFGKNNVYIEIMSHGLEIETRNHPKLVNLANKYKLPIIATSDSHYAHAEQAYTQELCLALGTKTSLSEKPKTEGGKRFKFDGHGYHILSREEIINKFVTNTTLPKQVIAQAVTNTQKLADEIDSVTLPAGQGQQLWPKVPIPDGYTEGQWLHKLATTGLTKIRNRPPNPDELERLRYEIDDNINKIGLSCYFIFTKALIEYAKSQQITIGVGRGSVGGCFTAYCLGIHKIDSLKYGLSFERFLNIHRVSMPDIDIDIEDERKDELIEWLKTTYGEENVANIATFVKENPKTALLDAARTLDLPVKIGTALSETIPEGIECSITDYETKLEKVCRKYSINTEVIKAAKLIEGTTRTVSTHPCGVIISSQPLKNWTPTYVSKKGHISTQWEYPELESRGLIKEDLLGLKTLTLIKKVCQQVGTSIDEIIKTGMCCQKTYQLLADGTNMCGIFQAEGGIGPLFASMKVSSIEDITCALSLFRPGPIGMGTQDAWVERKFGRQTEQDVKNHWKEWRKEHTKPISYYLNNPDLGIIPPYQHYWMHEEIADDVKPILKETNGLCIYQEQISALAMKLAGYTPAQADTFRKAIGKKNLELLNSQWEPFRDGMAQNGYSEEAAEAVWQIIIPFASYSFNKSHAVGYAILTYVTAYLKTHYLPQFYAAFISVFNDKEDKIRRVLIEAAKNQIKIHPPKIGKSDTHPIVIDNELYLGFSQISQISPGFAKDLTRLAPTQTLQELIQQIYELGIKINSKQIETLTKAGCFDQYGTRKHLLTQKDTLTKYYKALKKNPNLILTLPPNPEPHPQDSLIDIITWEREVLRHEISKSIFTNIMERAEESQKWAHKYSQMKPQHWDDLADLPKKCETIFLGVVCKKPRKTKSKNGKPYAHTEIELKNGQTIKIMAFNDAMEQLADTNIGTLARISASYVGDRTFFLNQLQNLHINNQGLIEKTIHTNLTTQQIRQLAQYYIHTPLKGLTIKTIHPTEGTQHWPYTKQFWLALQRPETT